MRRDKAVCVWSHAVGCYVKVGQEGEWELVGGGGSSRGRSSHGQAEKEGGDGQKDPPGGEKAHLATPLTRLHLVPRLVITLFSSSPVSPCTSLPPSLPLRFSHPPTLPLHAVPSPPAPLLPPRDFMILLNDR